jgi:hypothetical protein
MTVSGRQRERRTDTSAVADSKAAESTRVSPTRQAAELAGLEAIDEPSRELMESHPTAARRRGRRGVDPLEVITLLRDDEDMYRWHFGASRRDGSRRRGRRGLFEDSPEGEVVEQYRFVREGANQITSLWTSQDAKLTPRQGLRQLERRAAGARPKDSDEEDASGWAQRAASNRDPASSWWRIGPITTVDGASDSLVLVHGTFSKGDMYISEFLESAEGAELLERAWRRYEGRVYIFNHPTMAVSPILNAVDLAMSLPAPGSAKGEIHLVAHSRGGLVVRWAIDVLRPDLRAKAVLVAAPLNGTSLASPARARAVMNGLTSYGKALEKISSLFALPFLAVPNMIIRGVTTATGLLAKTPVFDAAVALVPGLHSMSSVASNRELDQILRRGEPAKGRYLAIRANFESAAIGWRFWKLLRPSTAKQKAIDWGADVLFPGANDLVVDSDSMGGFVRGRSDAEATLPKTVRLHDFGTSDTIHHCAYFRQPKTVELIREHLDIK